MVCSCCSLQKEWREQIAPVTIYFKSNGSILLSSLFLKEQRECMSSLNKEQQEWVCHYKRVIRSFQEWFASNLFFSPCFSSFCAQNKRANHSSSLVLLFVKERIALVPLFKRWTRAKRGIQSFKIVNRSFTLKKWAIRTKNQRTKSRPWTPRRVSLRGVRTINLWKSKIG